MSRLEVHVFDLIANNSIPPCVVLGAYMYRYTDQWFLFQLFKRGAYASPIGVTKILVVNYANFYPNLYTSFRGWQFHPIFKKFKDFSGHFRHENSWKKCNIFYLLSLESQISSHIARLKTIETDRPRVATRPFSTTLEDFSWTDDLSFHKEEKCAWKETVGRSLLICNMFDKLEEVYTSRCHFYNLLEAKYPKT